MHDHALKGTSAPPLQSKIVHQCSQNANRAKRERSLHLSGLSDEVLDRTAKTLCGSSSDRLLVHGVALQTGGDYSHDKSVSKEARPLDGMLRHSCLELCAVSRIADYLLYRFQDLPLQLALTSQDELLKFLSDRFFLRHFTKHNPAVYDKWTLRKSTNRPCKRQGQRKTPPVDSNILKSYSLPNVVKAQLPNARKLLSAVLLLQTLR